MPADTGNGSTIAFSGTGFTASFEEIDAGEAVREAINDSHLTTSGKHTYIPGDLEEPGELRGIFQWNQSFGTFPATTTTAETVTVTYPLRSGETTNGTLSGKGLVTRVRRPTSRNGEKMMGEITVKWDGTTGPTFTAGS